MAHRGLRLLSCLLLAAALICAGCEKPADYGIRASVAASQPATAPDYSDNPAAPAALRGEKIVEADAIMIDAITGLRKLQSGGERGDPQRPRQVLASLLQLIRDYPQSDQVDSAFFYAGELLREYFNDCESAAAYYRRAYQADPHTPHPARFQRAALLDFRLNKPAEAVAEYREVLRHEARLEANWANSNAAFAAARIKALSPK